MSNNRKITDVKYFTQLSVLKISSKEFIKQFNNSLKKNTKLNENKKKEKLNNFKKEQKRIMNLKDNIYKYKKLHYNIRDKSRPNNYFSKLLIEKPFLDFQIKVPKLTINNFSKNTIYTIICNYSFYNFSNLKELDLSNNNIGSLSSDSFYNLKLLERLNLSNNNLINGNFYSYNYKYSIFFKPKSVHVRGLNLVEARADNIWMCFKDLNNLKYLDLSNNNLTELNFIQFLEFYQHSINDIFNENSVPEKIHSNFNNLIELNVSNNKIIKISKLFLLAFKNLKVLNLDNISHNKINLLSSFIRDLKDSIKVYNKFNPTNRRNLTLSLNGLFTKKNNVNQELSNNLIDLNIKNIFKNINNIKELDINLEHNINFTELAKSLKSNLNNSSNSNSAYSSNRNSYSNSNDSSRGNSQYSVHSHSSFNYSNYNSNNWLNDYTFNGIRLIKKDDKSIQFSKTLLESNSNKNKDNFYKKIINIENIKNKKFTFENQTGIDCGGLKRIAYDRFFQIYLEKNFKLVNDFYVIHSEKYSTTHTKKLYEYASLLSIIINIQIHPELIKIMNEYIKLKNTNNTKNTKNKFKELAIRDIIPIKYKNKYTKMMKNNFLNNYINSNNFKFNNLKIENLFSESKSNNENIKLFLLVSYLESFGIISIKHFFSMCNFYNNFFENKEMSNTFTNKIDYSQKSIEKRIKIYKYVEGSHILLENNEINSLNQKYPRENLNNLLKYIKKSDNNRKKFIKSISGTEYYSGIFRIYLKDSLNPISNIPYFISTCSVSINVYKSRENTNNTNIINSYINKILENTNVMD